MLFMNRRRSGSSRERAWDRGSVSAHGSYRSGEWILAALRPLSSLVVWMLLIVAGAGLTTGYLTPQRGGGSVDERRSLRNPIRTDTVRYSSKYTIAVSRACGEHRELLTDYGTFCSIWDEVSPDIPMKLKMVSPALGPYPRGHLPDIKGPTVEVNARNFAETRLLLDQIRILIREGDGTGRGRLALERLRGRAGGA